MLAFHTIYFNELQVKSTNLNMAFTDFPKL